jgi:peptidoglycan/LPS O-acetylase OafA/YrhL
MTFLRHPDSSSGKHQKSSKMAVETSQNKFYGLDHLRALAITLVFFYHYQMPLFGHPDWLPDLVKFGWTGVDLFFVLSGFLIASQLFEQIKNDHKIDLKTFFLKRFFRIIPAYWTVLMVYFLCPFFREREALMSVWKFLFFIQNFGLNIVEFGTFSHAWSLCVEEHFYLLLPIILFLLLRFKVFKKAYWLLIALFLFGIFIRHYGWENFYLPNIEEDDAYPIWYKYLYYPSYNRLDGLLVGVSIAAIYQFLPRIWLKIGNFGNEWIAWGFIVLFGAYFLCEDQTSYYATVFGFPTVAIGYGFLVLGALSPTSFLFKWQSKITTFIATLSYSIYLIHKGVFHLTQNLISPLGIHKNSHLMLIICLISCLFFAFLLHLIVEKPFIKFRKKIVFS